MVHGILSTEISTHSVLRTLIPDCPEDQVEPTPALAFVHNKINKQINNNNNNIKQREKKRMTPGVLTDL